MMSSVLPSFSPKEATIWNSFPTCSSRTFKQSSGPPVNTSVSRSAMYGIATSILSRSSMRSYNLGMIQHIRMAYSKLLFRGQHVNSYMYIAVHSHKLVLSWHTSSGPGCYSWSEPLENGSMPPTRSHCYIQILPHFQGSLFPLPPLPSFLASLLYPQPQQCPLHSAEHSSEHQIRHL